MTLAQTNCIPHRKPRTLSAILITWIALARQRRALASLSDAQRDDIGISTQEAKKRQIGHFGMCQPIGAAKSDNSAHIHTILTPCGLDFSRPSANIQSKVPFKAPQSFFGGP